MIYKTCKLAKTFRKRAAEVSPEIIGKYSLTHLIMCSFIVCHKTVTLLSIVTWGRNECVTNEPQRTSAGRLVEGRSDWIPRDRKNTQGPQITEGKGTTFALQTARSLCSSDDHF